MLALTGVDSQKSINEFGIECGSKAWLLICILEPTICRINMQAIRKSAYRAKLQIVWRNRFPVRREKRAGVLLLVEKEQQIASNSWVQRLIRFFRLSVLCKALWHVRSLP